MFSLLFSTRLADGTGTTGTKGVPNKGRQKTAPKKASAAVATGTLAKHHGGDDTLSLMLRRVWDVAGVNSGKDASVDKFGLHFDHVWPSF